MIENKLITTVTPLRVSFFGGGTDLKKFYQINGGQVISATINKYIYVTIKDHSKLYNEKYRLNYSITEKVSSVDKIKNDIIRACLKLLEIDIPLSISTYSDLPANSGLGSSSSFCVGLLNALHHYLGESVTVGQLADEACKVEIEILKNVIGKQDQYIAAYGGFNNIIFSKNNSVQIEPIDLKLKQINYLFDNSVLVWSGVKRDAAKVLTKQNDNTKKNMIYLNKLVSNCKSFKNLIKNYNKEDILRKTGKLLEQSWEQKKSLNKSISSKYLNKIHENVISMGGFGGKLCGAGAGGFFFELIDKDKKKEILNKIGSKKIVEIKFEPQGSRLLYKS